MGLLITLRIALRALAKNKMRAGLTVLGVVIGIAAVTTMVSIGQSASQLVQGELNGLGTNVILVMPGHRQRGGVRRETNSLTSSDSLAISAECPNVLAASAIVGASGQVIYGHDNWSPKEMFGVDTEYLTVRNWPIRRGGFFHDSDVTSAAKVCVIGQTIVAKLFQTTNPIGQHIRIKNIPFRVIGVLQEKGANMMGNDQDDIILIPYTTVRKRLYGSNFDNVHAIMVSARSTAKMGEATFEIKQLLYERHSIAPGESPDFMVQSTKEIAGVVSLIMGIMTMMLSAIAGISLLVGGVGIMNIMLVSVTERTREIGIRMAVGARGRDILWQFLVEAVLLSCIGGLIGLGLGIVTSSGVTMIINYVSTGRDWPIVISIPAALLAIVFSAFVGVTFGLFPALRASRLDPIDALRYE